MVRDNRLTGDSPAANLAATILGPAATDRTNPDYPNDQRLYAYGPGSPLEQAAEALRGGAPAPADPLVLDTLTDKQKAALAGLVTR